MRFKQFEIASLSAIFLLALALSLKGEAASAENTKDFGDWTVTCEEERCSATHKTDLVLLEVLFTVGKDPRIFLHVAKEAEVGSPISVRLEDGQHAHLETHRCAPSYCTAEANYAKLSPKMIAELKGSKGAIVAYLVNDVIIIAPVSFIGYSDASAFAQDTLGQ
jgi:invasion protein IalB